MVVLCVTENDVELFLDPESGSQNATIVVVVVVVSSLRVQKSPRLS